MGNRKDTEKEKWEYKIIKINPYDLSEEKLNALGKEGWELVSTIPLSFLGISEKVQYIFKRKI